MRRLALLIIVAAVLCAGVAPAANAQSGLTPKAIEQISQSVVFILEYVNGEPVSTGSGTIVEPTGLIYTNRHVVEAGGDFEIYQTTTLGSFRP
ncbi:MAG: serine protease [Chloroflexi bacterium]|nr:serine protease [Chloroflexota bacterium]